MNVVRIAPDRRARLRAHLVEQGYSPVDAATIDGLANRAVDEACAAFARTVSMGATVAIGTAAAAEGAAIFAEMLDRQSQEFLEALFREHNR